MKFSSSLQFNAVPEWREHYIDYDHLKELIFKLERAHVPGLADDVEETDTEHTFAVAIDAEARKINAFYEATAQKLEAAHAAFVSGDASGHTSTSPAQRDVTGTGHGNSALQGASARGGAGRDPADERYSDMPEAAPVRSSGDFEDFDFEESVAHELEHRYVSLNDLQSFIDLNREGLRKALKKFDKVTGSSLLAPKMREYQTLPVFADASTAEIAEKCHQLVQEYAKHTHLSEGAAHDRLQRLLREHVVYERNTVWRELISLERRQQAVQPQSSEQPLSSTGFIRKVRIGNYTLRVPARTESFLVALVLFSLPLVFKPFLNSTQNRCLALVAFASTLWATEALPLFVTGLLVPFLVVVLRIPVKPDSEGAAMNASEAAQFVFQHMWSPVITVLLGGFALAAALSKYGLAKALAQALLRGAGSGNPRIVLLTLMLVAAFLCMWISNVAAPVLLLGVAEPLLRLLPPSDPFAPALILGIALASNVGGMASPIASPQNVLALQNMDPKPSWAVWFVVALPVSVISILLLWLLLCFLTPISQTARDVVHHHVVSPTSANASGFEFKKVHCFIVVTTVGTILLWCFAKQLEPIFGDMGVVALLPLVLLFGTNVLTSADFNNFLWTIVALAMGGIVLGKSVESCGLLATVAMPIENLVSGMPLFVVVLLFGALILVVASFVSHTVAALIILPLVKSVGENLGGGQQHPRLLVMLAALLCSAAMALPTSGFPNVTAVCSVDEFGKPYLTARDFISRGIPASIAVYLVVVTVGYALCALLQF